MCGFYGLNFLEQTETDGFLKHPRLQSPSISRLMDPGGFPVIHGLIQSKILSSHIPKLPGKKNTMQIQGNQDHQDHQDHREAIQYE